MKMMFRVSIFEGVISKNEMMDLFFISPLFLTSFLQFWVEDSSVFQSRIEPSLKSARARCIATKSSFLREQTKQHHHGVRSEPRYRGRFAQWHPPRGGSARFQSSRVVIVEERVPRHGFFLATFGDFFFGKRIFNLTFITRITGTFTIRFRDQTHTKEASTRSVPRYVPWSLVISFGFTRKSRIETIFFVAVFPKVAFTPFDDKI